MLDRGFLIVWHDVASEAEEEFRRFHRIEHMPERLAVPGFTLGRRYVDPDSALYRYLTLYEVTSPAVFENETYRARLAAPTPWTSRMSPQMRNFVRRVCRTAASEGVAIGGTAATFWLRLGGGPAAGRAAGQLVGRAMDLDPVAAAHVGLVDAAATGARKDAMQTRDAGSTADFDGVFIVECDSRTALSDLMAGLVALVEETCGAPPVLAALYDLALIYRPTWREAAAG